MKKVFCRIEKCVNCGDRGFQIEADDLRTAEGCVECDCGSIRLPTDHNGLQILREFPATPDFAKANRVKPSWYETRKIQGSYSAWTEMGSHETITADMSLLQSARLLVTKGDGVYVLTPKGAFRREAFTETMSVDGMTVDRWELQTVDFTIRLFNK